MYKALIFDYLVIRVITVTVTKFANRSFLYGSLNDKSRAIGMSYEYNWSQDWKFGDVSFREKLLQEFIINPYRKPTQVSWSSRPRYTGKVSSRNSAKKLSVSSRYALPVFGGMQQMFVNRLFSKNTGSCKSQKEKYRSWDLSGTGKLIAGVEVFKQLRTRLWCKLQWTTALTLRVLR